MELVSTSPYAGPVYYYISNETTHKNNGTERHFMFVGPLFLTSALDGGEWSASYPCHFTPKERSCSAHWIGGWVGHRFGLDAVEKRKILHCQELNLSCPANYKKHKTEKLFKIYNGNNILQHWLTFSTWWHFYFVLRLNIPELRYSFMFWNINALGSGDDLVWLG
jgi:hypothetical protein